MVDRVGAAWEEKRSAERRSHPRVWRDGPGRRFRVRVADEWNAGHALDGQAQVRSIGAVLVEYTTHPEAKSLGFDGEACSRVTVGALQPRPVRVGMIRYIGKESNKLDEREAGMVRRMADAVNVYAVPVGADGSWEDARMVLAAMPCQETALAAKMTERSLRRIIAGARCPVAKVRDKLIALASEHARTILSGGNVEGGHLTALAQRTRTAGHRCLGCDISLSGDPRRRWCGDACRMRAQRAHHGAEAPMSVS